MKASRLVVIPMLVAGIAACHRQNAGDRTAETNPTPSPVVAAPAPQATAPGDDASRSGMPEASEGPATTGSGAGAGMSRERSRAASVPRSAPATVPSDVPAPSRREAPQEPSAPQESALSASVQRPEPVVIPAGTELPVKLGETLSSDESQPEQKVTAELVDSISSNGRVVLPAGSEVIGHVVVAQRSGRVKGRARLVVAFQEIRAHGTTYMIDAPRWDVTAASSSGRDAKIAGGAAAAGAIIGAITGGGKGALKGGAIGGAAGGAAVLVTRGYEVELPAGSRHRITLREPLRIE